MTKAAFDITPFLHRDEGQHFERKSLFEGPEGAKVPRERRIVRDQVVQYVAGFANAEGGILVLGLEDDHSVTGHALPPDAVTNLLSVPCSRLQPPQAEGFVVEHDGKALIVFDVTAADVPVQVIGDGFPLRIGDQTMQVSETHVRTLKLQGLTESWESKRSGCVPEDLDRAKLEQARRGAGLAAWSDEAYLLKRKLADHRGARLELRHAAELLFASRGPDHANAGVRIFRVVGTERRTGAEHNVEERPRIEGSLSAVIEEATRAISGLLRRPSRLVGTRFRPVPEYPQFCWQEALLNAVAHRDYGDEGSGVEVWLFDDRMEIVSPGGFVGDLTLEEVLSLQRTHRSRNPRLMRVLVDLGVAREQGEGIPRMFAEMEDAFLPQPEIAVGRRSVTVTLRNTPTLTAGDRAFVARLGSTPVTDEEFRALLHAQRHGRVENADLRLLGGLDTLGASLLLRGLRDRGLLDLHAHGANSFYTVNALLLPSRESEAPAPDRGGLAPDRGGLVPDRGGLAPDRGGLAPNSGRATLGTRPRKESIRAAILSLCAEREWTTPLSLAEQLVFSPAKLTERHLAPMVAEGRLQRRYPDNPSHPEQAYRAVASPAQLNLLPGVSK